MSVDRPQTTCIEGAIDLRGSHPGVTADILDSIPAHIALLGQRGQIIAVNRAWRRFGEANGWDNGALYVGQNYLETCDAVHGPGAEDAREAARGIRAVLEGVQEEFAFEYPCHSPSERRWFRLTVTSMRGGEVPGAVVMHVDITERREAEEELSRNQALLRMATQLSRLGAWSIDVSTGALAWSGEVSMFRDVPDDFAPSVHGAIEICAPEYRELVANTFQACACDGASFDVEFEVIANGGQHAWVRCIGEPVRDSSGNIVRVQGAFQDITSQKGAELRENRLARRLGNTLENITDAFVTFDFDWRITYVNREAERLIGRGRDALLGTIVWDALPELAESEFECRIRGAFADRRPAEFECYDEVRHCWLGVRAFPAAEGMAVYCHDISDRRRVRDAIQSSEERFRLFSKATNDAIWDWDLRAHTFWWNDGFETLFGYRRENVQSNVDSWISRIHPEDHERVTSALNGVLRGSGGPWTAQYRFLREDGSYAHVLDRGYVIRDDQGEAIRMIGGLTDQTAQKHAEAQLAEQAALLNLASDAILVRDLEHRVLFWNRGAESIYGWTAAEVLDRPVTEILYDDLEEFLKADAAVNRNGEWSGELHQRTRDGSAVTILGRWTLVRDESNQPKAVLAINTDITDRKRLEQQFLRAQRMESIGTLAGGIAHDLNNVLAPILMAAGILRNRADDESSRALLETVEGSAMRGADLIKQVLSFARGVEGNRIALSPLHLVRDVQKIIFDTFPRNIHCDVATPRDLWTVNADPTQLHQVMMNLCVNARDAMPDGGKLTINLENHTVDEVYAGMHLEARPGPYVVLTVADTGAGIPRGLHEKIFEPFFTTKGIGKGTGLGLSTTFSIVREHGGFVNLESEPGRGSKFRVYLPAISATPADLEPQHDRAPLLRGNGELILLVDDEASLREVTRKALEHSGYRVLLAANGAQGVALYVQHQDDVAVVLTDMSMPVMDGPALIVALKSINPDVRIIGSSGQAENEVVAKAREAGGQYFVPKPYTAATLLRVLRDILSEAPGADESEPAMLLVVHQEPAQRDACRFALAADGYDVLAASGREDAETLLDANPGRVRIIILESDQALSPEDGLAAKLAEAKPPIAVIVLASVGDRVTELQQALGPQIHVLPAPVAAGDLTRKVRSVLRVG